MKEDEIFVLEIPDEIGLNLVIRLLQDEQKRLTLELAKVRVAIDAIERGKPEEIPPSIKEWLDKKQAEERDKLPIG